MASCYLINNGGNWTDTTKWAASDVSALANINDGATPTASDDVFLTANSGQCTISAASVGKTLTCTGYTNTLTHGAFDLNISGAIVLVSGMTYTPSSVNSRLLITGAAGNLTTGGKLLYHFYINSGNTIALQDNLSFVAQKDARITLNGNGLVLNGKTISGNSATNRVLIQTNTLGTTQTLTNTTGTFANADFRDITFSTNTDYSAITGLSGDCGGNSGSTLTTGATQTYTGGTGNWSDVTKWTSRVPLPQDNVLMSGVTGGTITADMPRLGKSIDWTGASGTPSFLQSVATTIYGSYTLISGMTVSGSSGTLNFEGRGSFTLTSAGNNMTGSNGSTVVFAMFGGTMTLQDAFLMNTAASGGTLQIDNGTFTANNFSVTACVIQINTNGVATTVNMGSGTWTPTRTLGATSIWRISNTAGLTLNAGTSTIAFTQTNANSYTFQGQGLTYNNLSITGGGAGAVIISGNNTFAKPFQIVGGGTKTITITATSTQTFTKLGNFGNGASVLTINTGGGAAATFTAPTSSSDLDGTSLNLTSIVATQTNKWYAGLTPPSVDGGGNTNWIFTPDPTPNANNPSRFGGRLGSRFQVRLHGRNLKLAGI